MTIVLTRAGWDEGGAALHGLGPVTPPDLPRLVPSLAEPPDHHPDRAAGMAEHRGGWRIAVKTRPAGTPGVAPLEKRWVIASTNAWPGRYRRHRTDSERRVESRTTMIPIRNIHLRLNRLAPCGRPAFHDRKEAA
jgi:hypothetical protein